MLQIVFIDEIDAVGSKRYDSNSSGEKEIQRTMLELLNQLDGFDERGDVKVTDALVIVTSLFTSLPRDVVTCFQIGCLYFMALTYFMALANRCVEY